MNRENESRKLDIVVPCFNEEENIERFFSETEKVSAELPGLVFRYIFVDDGSVDRIWIR